MRSFTHTPDDDPHRHVALREPSPWIERFANLIPSSGTVLDVACGGGRHTRLFLERGHPVTAIDIDVSTLDDIGEHPDLQRVQADLEDGRPFPLADRQFAAVVVTNYLHRPLFPALVAAVAPGGVLLYETFTLGNERFGRPRNPDHLLRPSELLEVVRDTLRVIAYEDVIVKQPRPAAVQRICARNETLNDERTD